MNNLGTLLVILSVAFIGMAALLLVANELGARAGLAFPGRLMLVGALGLGVIAFSIKAGLAFYLNSLSGQQVAAVRSFKLARPVPDRLGRLDGAGSWQTTDYSSWRALPRHVKDPVDNPTSPAKVALGKKLFFDPRLSIDNSVSCASCHILADGGDDNARFSTGINGQLGGRNAPSVWNAAFLTRLFWDGRARSLEEQAKGPPVNPVEMGMPSLEAVAQKIAGIEEYRTSFKEVFEDENPVTMDNIAKAIAAYERTLITPQTPYDRFVRGDDSALSKQQIRGMALFAETGCRNCHVDPTFSSAGRIKPFGVYRSFPVYPDNPYIEKYDLLEGGKPQAFRVPSLRNVARTAPYFHNGAVNELEEAIRIMAVSQLGKTISNRDEDDVGVIMSGEAASSGEKSRRLILTRNRALSDSEVSDIAAFLHSLSAPGLKAGARLSSD